MCGYRSPSMQLHSSEPCPIFVNDDCKCGCSVQTNAGKSGSLTTSQKWGLISQRCQTDKKAKMSFATKCHFWWAAEIFHITARQEARGNRSWASLQYLGAAGLTGWSDHVTGWAALSSVATGQKCHGDLPNSFRHGAVFVARGLCATEIQTENENCHLSSFFTKPLHWFLPLWYLVALMILCQLRMTHEDP